MANHRTRRTKWGRLLAETHVGSAELARLLGLHRNTVGGWVRGLHDPRGKARERAMAAVQRLAR